MLATAQDLQSRLATALLCWFGAIVSLALGAWLVCAAPNCTATALDAALMHRFAAQRYPVADWFFSVVTWLGSLVLLIPILILAIVILVRRRRARAAGFLAASLAGTVAMVHIFKMAVARPRPEDLEVLPLIPWDHSFPSAHTAQICSVVLAGTLLLPRLGRAARAYVCAGALLCIGLVAASRVYLQVHYPSDVLAGAFASVLWVMGLALLMLPEARNARAQ